MSIKALEPSEGQITYWDEGLKTFGLRVSPGGTKTWTLLVGQERQRIKLGNYPTISLKVARELAREKLAERTLGRHRPRTKTFAEALDTFEEVHCPTLRPKTVYELKRLIRKYFLPKLGRKPLADIAPDDITDITDRLSPGTAWHAHAAVGNLFAWAVPRYIKVSPLTGVRRPSKSTPRARVLTDEELGMIWRACEQSGEAETARLDEHPIHREVAGSMPALGASPPRLPASFCTIVKLLILTGQRRGEIAAIQSSWIKNTASASNSKWPSGASTATDSATRNSGSRSDLWTLTIPASVTKNGREQTIPIGPVCTNLLLPLSHSSQGLLFPARGRTSTPFNGFSKSKAALDKDSGVKNWTLHDIRRTYATNMADLGVAPHIIERLLNHVSGQISGVSAIYNRAKYLEEMREAVGRYEAHLTRIVCQETPHR